MADFSTAARPYAKAAFESAKDSNQYDAWSERLSMLSVLVQNQDMAHDLN